MAALLSAEARRLLSLESRLRGGGIPKGGVHGSSPATFKRDLRRLRDELGAVVVFDHFEDRYRLTNLDWPGVAAQLIAEVGAAAQTCYPRQQR